LAARLSEDPALRVLLVDAGPFYRSLDEYPPELRDASSALASIPGHHNGWSFMAQVTPKVAFPVVRGKAFGGSSAVNGTMFIRGAPADFDAWSALGNEEWSHEKLLPYFLKLEADQDFGGPLHGSEGPIPVRRPQRDELGADQSTFMEACVENGFAEIADKNADHGEGAGPIPLNNIGNVRINTALAYILPNLARPNLTVWGEVFVRRVIFEGRAAVGIEIEQDGTRRSVRGGEIILSAGAIKSPHILMLSGIGPAKDLEAAGIPVIHANEAVGKNLTDHPATVVGYRTRRMVAHRPGQPQMQVMLDFTAEGSSCRTDLAIIPLCGNAFAAAMKGSDERGGLLRWLPAPLRHPLSTLRALRGTSIKTLLTQYRHRKDRLITCIMNQADARGELRITSSDPHVPPDINYHNFELPSDRRRMREAVRLAVRMLQSRAFGKLGATVTTPAPDILASDGRLDDWIVASAFTAFHTASSCRMGAEGDPDAVVDQYCRVRGVTGLRVVDCSIMPFVPRRGVAASAIMLGERAADLVRETLRNDHPNE
jgi:choline dehydrogenase